PPRRNRPAVQRTFRAVGRASALVHPRRGRDPARAARPRTGRRDGRRTRAGTRTQRVRAREGAVEPALRRDAAIACRADAADAVSPGAGVCGGGRAAGGGGEGRRGGVSGGGPCGAWALVVLRPPCCSGQGAARATVPFWRRVVLPGQRRA